MIVNVSLVGGNPITKQAGSVSVTAALTTLSPVVRLAAELLTSRRLDRVGQCSGRSWLFLIHSRNHSRRWWVKSEISCKSRGVSS
jgi:predicted RNA-binding Zn ribbon-like protein